MDNSISIVARYVCMYVHIMCVNTYVCTYVHSKLYICIYYACKHIHTYICTYTVNHTYYVCKHICTYIRTYVHSKPGDMYLLVEKRHFVKCCVEANAFRQKPPPPPPHTHTQTAMEKVHNTNILLNGDDLFKATYTNEASGPAVSRCINPI